MITKQKLKDATHYELSVLAEALEIEREGKSDDELRELILVANAEKVKEETKPAKKRGRPSKKSQEVEQIAQSEEIVEKKPAKKTIKSTNKNVKAESQSVETQIEKVEPEKNNIELIIKEGIESGEVESCSGVLDIHADGYGFIRVRNYEPGEGDIYVASAQIKKFKLRRGDFIQGWAKKTYDNKPAGIIRIDAVNGFKPEELDNRPNFDDLTPIYPDERLKLEINNVKNDLAVRAIDLIAPIGKGQRSMIVSPPKAGKTTLLKQIANSISANYPDVKLFVLLIDERPEEVTDMQRSIKGEVIYSTFDEMPEHHTRAAEFLLARAKREVEHGQNVVILMDSLTRLARAYNLTIPPTGRTLSGGIDPGALHSPKRFFGSARNIENGGSLTIIATALVDTGSRMDDVIYEEFKGTGNMEIHLDRKLSEKRIFPAIDLNRSSTRREELLLTPDELEGVWSMRKLLNSGDPAESAENLVKMMLKSDNNEEFIKQLNLQMRALQKEGYTILSRN